MSDYYGSDSLEDWLAEEVFSIKTENLPADIVEKFEEWREPIKNQINTWWDSDDGDGETSWRDFGRGFYAIDDKDDDRFEALVLEAKIVLTGRGIIVPNVHLFSVGDQVEFRSDLQTEKGPSTGSVVRTEGKNVIINHSDTEESFIAMDLKVEKVDSAEGGLTTWTFK